MSETVPRSADETETETDALRCSFASQRRGDPLVGTAAPAVGILLIEQPGPWGRQALIESGLDRDVGAQVSARAVARGLRVLLIRRPGRPALPMRRRWAIAHCTPGSEMTSWGEFGSDDELLDLPLDGSGGTGTDEPTYLVCTHGRHDACCAIRGRLVAAELARLRPDQTWECSHVGGDRFAANLLVLPHGLYYGRVDSASVEEIVGAHERGDVVPELLRGRTTFAPAAQAAQHQACRVTGATAINAYNPVDVTTLPGGSWRVRLDGGGAGDLVATVRMRAAGPAALLTCAAVQPAHPPAFQVSDLTLLD